MPKYLMKFPNTASSALLEYDDAGFLLKFELEKGSFGQDQLYSFFNKFPMTLKILEDWIQSKFKNVYISKVEEDLSFEAFYNAYAHKVSKRAVSENIWNKMPDIEKAKAIKHIAIYEQFLKTSNVNKKYPETYLNSEMWNN